MFDLDKHFAVHASALRISSLRSEMLARNLANADTPNYKATDIDFQQALGEALGDSAAGTLRTTRSAHLASANTTGTNINGVQMQFVERQPLAPSLDGNTVDVSMEQAEFAKNAIRYQASLNFINSQMRGLMTAITGQ
ncbi:MAG: flagellar basal body rod protein FlgB [Gammaproteobacteria bacterium]|jgi:flagellar basal-body rod protein FlgB